MYRKSREQRLQRLVYSSSSSTTTTTTLPQTMDCVPIVIDFHDVIPENDGAIIFPNTNHVALVGGRCNVVDGTSMATIIQIQ